MVSSPAQLTLELRPKSRLDVIDVTQLVRAEMSDFFTRYGRTLYCSYHTTAGYLEQSLSSRLHYSRERLEPFVRLFQQLFPEGANYEHDKLDLRNELSESQKQVEPKNADSHLAFISSGLNPCVTYRNRPGAAVHFIDLDGVHEHGSRTRKTTILGFNYEEDVFEGSFSIPVARHHINSINLREPELGFFAHLQRLVDDHGVNKGRIDIALDPEEEHSGLTVNEFETLLMRHDLTEVLRDPLRFMADGGRQLLSDPRAITSRTLDYARYDFVRVLNELIELTGMSESFVERLLARAMGLPARRLMRIKRSVSLLVTDGVERGRGLVVQGRYQSPVLMQWRQAANELRRLNLRLVRFA